MNFKVTCTTKALQNIAGSQNQMASVTFQAPPDATGASATLTIVLPVAQGDAFGIGQSYTLPISPVTK
jgi:hypothetical protein